ncbi:hypothetical protein EYC80_008920 [Monilinia laxa]|uniref:Uncharacterized protein n=1 Tax=Monilinia laxa TaxID=61186 RepID=A0A5N6K1T9_MONLA|nr:hypothetical protein EYC80_008920 [Monilinia laxa]
MHSRRTEHSVIIPMLSNGKRKYPVFQFSKRFPSALDLHKSVCLDFHHAHFQHHWPKIMPQACRTSKVFWNPLYLALYSSILVTSRLHMGGLCTNVVSLFWRIGVVDRLPLTLYTWVFLESGHQKVIYFRRAMNNPHTFHFHTGHLLLITMLSYDYEQGRHLYGIGRELDFPFVFTLLRLIDIWEEDETKMEMDEVY